MVRAFHYDDTATFMEGIPDYSVFVQQGNIIHLLDFGLSPEVLINNTTYPIGIQDLDNKDIALTLDKYQTKATPISDDTLHDVKGNLIAAAIAEHKAVINEKKYDKAIHSLAPDKTVDGKTLVMETTGETDGSRKRLTVGDIITLKEKMDRMHLPATGRRLVLSPEHVSDLLRSDQNFANQYYNYTTGAISRAFGFEIFEYTNTPYYTTSNAKKAFGAVVTSQRPTSVNSFCTEPLCKGCRRDEVLSVRGIGRPAESGESAQLPTLLYGHAQEGARAVRHRVGSSCCIVFDIL